MLPRLLFGLLFLVAAATEQSDAQSLLIMDCQGFTRAAQEVKAGSLNRIEVSIAGGVSSNLPHASNIKLVNAVTGESFSAETSGGVAVFENVPPGTFTLESATEGLRMGALWIGPMEVAPALAAGVAIGAGTVGAGAVAGIGVAVAEVSSSGGGGSSFPPAPVPQPPQPPPTIAPPPSCATCNPNARPDPLDDFFGTGRVTLSPSK